MKIAETLQTLASVLGSGQGLVAMLVLSVLAIAAPFADRYLIRRKRLAYRVLYNSKLGVSPDVDDEDVTAGLPPGADPGMRELADEMSRMTSVVVRLRNAGIEDTRPEDLQGHPLTLDFGGRVIWNARISDPSVENHRLAHKRSLTFLPADGADSEPAQQPSAKLEEVRKSSRRRFPWNRRAETAVAEARPSPNIHSGHVCSCVGSRCSARRNSRSRSCCGNRGIRGGTPRTSASTANWRAAGSWTSASRRG